MQILMLTLVAANAPNAAVNGHTVAPCGLFIRNRKAFLRSAYVLRYSVIIFIFTQHQTIDLPYS